MTCWSKLKQVEACQNMLKHVEYWNMLKLVETCWNQSFSLSFPRALQPGSLALLNAASDAFVAAPAAPSLRGSNLAVAQALQWQRLHCSPCSLKLNGLIHQSIIYMCSINTVNIYIYILYYIIYYILYIIYYILYIIYCILYIILYIYLCLILNHVY